MSALNLTWEQVDQLLKGINPLRIGKKDNQSHLEAYDVRAHLTRIFGFGGWSVETIDLERLYEQSKQDGEGDRVQTRWRAAYRATVKLTIYDAEGNAAVYTGGAVGTNWGWLPDTKRDETHDFAIKMAESQALKRAAINLGDQFGLSLYNDGSVKPLIGRTLTMPPEPPKKDDEKDQGGQQQEGVDTHLDRQLAPETPAPQGDSPDAPAGPDPASGSAPRAEGESAAGQDPTSEAALLERQEALIVELTEKALNIPEGVARPRAYLLSLQMEASRAGALGFLTGDGNGEAVPFKTLIEKRLLEVGT